MDIELLTEIWSELPRLFLDQSWKTRDARPERYEDWLNVILIKAGE